MAVFFWHQDGAWRIAVDMDNPVHRLFKTRYFPVCSFVDAMGRGSISYAWWSILEARPLLQARIHWRVGDDKSISLVASPWLPRPSTFRQMVPPRTLREDAWGEELFAPTGLWDEECIGLEFDLMDAEWSLSTPIHVGEVDRWCWHYDSKERFSVKSSYSLALH
ncbi:UNVERIFIED_CONTAM: hypothetical protein Sradi_0736700 [Sesamum radiatum]|uniref:DUF2071 domain-containing protein n=1 Tax=Sesamum radiatum TaxID=300843 RepID=A0AAW2VPF4_SESRA